MEAVIAALISAVVSAAVAFIAYRQSVRDFEAKEQQARLEFEVKTRQLAESVTAELIRQRIGPYSEFMRGLKCASSQHDTVNELDEAPRGELFELLQNTLYGPVGLLATHETRQLILHVRAGCILHQKASLKHNQLMLRLWALHLSLRSDLGISQPEWESAIEKIHQKAVRNEYSQWEELVKAYPWERLMVHSQDKLPEEARSGA